MGAFQSDAFQNDAFQVDAASDRGRVTVSDAPVGLVGATDAAVGGLTVSDTNTPPE